MFEGLINEFLFPVRSRLSVKLRREEYQEALGTAVTQSSIPTELAAQLNEKHLQTALLYDWILKQVPWDFSLNSHAKVLDIGSKNFAYCSVLCELILRHFSSGELTGLEVDPFRRLSNFYRRGDVALYHKELCSHYYPSICVRYETGDWLKHPAVDDFDLITCFFPFLYEDLHLRWGLSKKSFSPHQMYMKALQKAEWLLFFHQGNDERAESLRLLDRVEAGEIVFDRSFHQNPWMVRKHPINVLLVKSRWFRRRTLRFV